MKTGDRMLAEERKPNVISCRDCGGKVSVNAAACPHCGSKSYTATLMVARGMGAVGCLLIMLPFWLAIAMFAWAAFVGK